MKLEFAGPQSNINMYIILPAKCINSLEGLEEQFQSFIPVAVERRMVDYKNVTLMLPKFTIENVLNFKPILSQVGTKILCQSD